ncbi:MAG: threonine/serine exporter family protein, partial [Candidatus Onthomonas sp.]
MKDIELVLDFSAKLGKQMLLSGANLERVNTTIYRICHCYGLREISIFSLSSVIILSAKDADGESFTRQIRVPAFGIQLERLKRLTQLSNQILA